ncbi:universal stress protein [Methanosarcina sp. UBA5]|uniref:universal stress protein n=1 Tax=Methanosarcina sp. UBA5 TaxID=1915593 RepID=UPI0025F7F8E6|nr:universal stress protein [Methanosarcina sp. UBA5]
METIDFKKIMIATDGSACSRLVAEKGIELARLSGGKVYAVYVVSTDYLAPINGDSFPMGVDPYWKSVHEAWKKQGHEAVNSVKSLGETKGINVEPVLLEGNPSEELIQYAEEEKMDIIIMGTLGKTGLNKLLLGSVAEKLVRHSKVPVMVVRDKCNL